MTAYTGYLLIADISGYTAFLTSSEQDHANPILKSLLTSLVEQVGDPLHLWRMDGDAVLAYSTSEEFPSGETFLAICENLYNSFSTRRRDIIANTTCTCQACANVSDLDLKIMAHYADFEEMQIGPMKDISGADVILVHRMAKTDVKKVTGIGSYALFTDAAVKAMNIDAALTPFPNHLNILARFPCRFMTWRRLGRNSVKARKGISWKNPKAYILFAAIWNFLPPSFGKGLWRLS